MLQILERTYDDIDYMHGKLFAITWCNYNRVRKREKPKNKTSFALSTLLDFAEWPEISLYDHWIRKGKILDVISGWLITTEKKFFALQWIELYQAAAVFHWAQSEYFRRDLLAMSRITIPTLLCHLLTGNVRKKRQYWLSNGCTGISTAPLLEESVNAVASLSWNVIPDSNTHETSVALSYSIAHHFKGRKIKFGYHTVPTSGSTTGLKHHHHKKATYS